MEIWGWVEREKLEKIMLDYVRWIFRLDFCIPRYIIIREFGMDKLRVDWGIRARRFEERIRKSEEKIITSCWREKETNEWKDLYGRERKGFYERNG